MDNYIKNVNFNLPGFFHFNKLYGTLIKYYKNRPEVFKTNAHISAIFDSPSGVIWNGGRGVGLEQRWSRAELTAAKRFMEQNDIPVRFTFTNCLIEEKHLYDTYCNMILEIFANGKNEIIVNSELLESYIREKYGDQYKYVSSTTKRLIKKEDELDEFEKDYYQICIDYDYNNDLGFLKKIKNPQNAELLINAVCKPNCPLRKLHYESISRSQLNYTMESFSCTDQGKPFWAVQQEDNFIGIDKINQIYLPMGFTNMKLEGRTAPFYDLIEILLYYLIKEEFKSEVRFSLIEACMQQQNLLK